MKYLRIRNIEKLEKGGFWVPVDFNFDAASVFLVKTLNNSHLPIRYETELRNLYGHLKTKFRRRVNEAH
jgi:hypothetical protein